MKLNFAKTSLLLAAALTLSVPADARTRRSSYRYRDKDKKEESQESEIGKGQGYGLEKGAMPMAYEAPARIDCTGNWDVFFDGSFLYWFVGQDQMDIASYRTTDSPRITGIVKQDQEYTSGFKLAAGTSFNHDNWTAKIEYTRITSSTRTQTTPPTSPGAGNLRASTGWVTITTNHIDDATDDSSIIAQQINEIKTKWRVSNNVLDGELSRWAYQGRMLTLNTFFGTRGGWLRQKMRYSVYTLAAPTTELVNTIRSRSWYLGPRTGLDANWVLGYGFRLTGITAANILYQRSKVRGSYTDNATNATNYSLKDTVRSFAPVFDLGLGLGWGTYLMDNSWHLDFYAAYELHYWFNQNVMRSVPYTDQFTSTYNATPINPGSLYYHGLTLTASVDF